MQDWYSAFQRRVLTGEEEVFYLKRAIEHKTEEFESLEQDILDYLGSVQKEVPCSLALGGQTGLRFLSQAISNENSLVLHSTSKQHLKDLAKELQLVECPAGTPNSIVYRVSKTLTNLQATKYPFLSTPDPLTMFLDTAFAPRREEEQRSFLIERVFSKIFKARGWNL